MKSMTTKLMVTAAAMLMAGLASAQTVTAKVPFAFRANGAVMPAGTYSVTNQLTNSPHLIYVRNERSLRSVMLVPQEPLTANTGSGNAKLVFRCAGEDCSLAQIWTGGPIGYAAPMSKIAAHAEASIRMVTVHAD